MHSLNKNHKHLPEMQLYSTLSSAPLFTPVVGTHREGMVLTIPLVLSENRQKIMEVYANYYKQCNFVVLKQDCPDSLSPVVGEFDNNVEVFVGGLKNSLNVSVRLNNLMKGAAGTACQNINLMLGLDECSGLI